MITNNIVECVALEIRIQLDRRKNMKGIYYSWLLNHNDKKIADQ